MTENDLKMIKMEKERIFEELEHYKELSADYRKNFNKWRWEWYLLLALRRNSLRQRTFLVMRKWSA
jgi:hypothetical protein